MCKNASQYLELYAVKTTSAIETARCSYKKYYLRHGFVPNPISGRAQSFLANLTQELFKICKIRSIQTSSFRPHMNIVAEICNKSLILGLWTHLMQKRTDWTRQIPTIAFAHNVSVIPSLAISPFVILFNREPQLAIESQILQAVRESTVPGLAQNSITDFEMLHRALIQNVAENRDTAQHQQFVRAKSHNLKEGTLVYTFDFTHLTDISPKLTPKWKCPFRLEYFVGNNTARFEITFTGREEPTLVNLDYLKTAHERRQILRKFGPPTEHQISPAVAPSSRQTAKPPNQSPGSTTDQQQNNQRAR
jgi:hypothetical protein